MFCSKCGQEVPEGTKFCPNCGESVIEQKVRVEKPKKKKGKLIALIIVAVVIVAAIVAVSTSGGDSSSSGKYVSIVKNGYLGEFTDVTVEQMLSKYLSSIYKDITWEEGTSNDNEAMVQLVATGSSEELGLDDTIIQFTFLNEDVFKITGVQDGIGTIDKSNPKPSDVAYYLDTVYLYYFRDDYTTDESIINGTLKDVNAVSVLYGASADYDGDRKELCTLFNEKLIDMSAVELMYQYLGLSIDEVVAQEDNSTDSEDVQEEPAEPSETSTTSSNNESKSSVITTLSHAAGSFEGYNGYKIVIEAYTDMNYTQYSADAIGYMSVYGYDEGYIYNAEDFSSYDLGKGYYICEGSEETLIMEISDNGDGGYYVAIYHDDEYMHLLDDFVSYPFS